MVTIYSKNDCAQCKMLKKQLNRAGVSYMEFNMDEQPEKREYVKSKGWSSAPVLESDAGDFSGFNPVELRKVIAYYTA